MAAERVWIATCELCERTEQFPGGLDVEPLGETLTAAGWFLPHYGGTFHRKCYNRMRHAMGQAPIPEPDPLDDLRAAIAKCRNILWDALDVDPPPPAPLALT